MYIYFITFYFYQFYQGTTLLCTWLNLDIKMLKKYIVFLYKTTFNILTNMACLAI